MEKDKRRLKIEKEAFFKISTIIFHSNFTRRWTHVRSRVSTKTEGCTRAARELRASSASLHPLQLVPGIRRAELHDLPWRSQTNCIVVTQQLPFFCRFPHLFRGVARKFIRPRPAAILIDSACKLGQSEKRMS